MASGVRIELQSGASTVAASRVLHRVGGVTVRKRIRYAGTGVTPPAGLAAPTNLLVAGETDGLAVLFYPVAGATGHDVSVDDGATWTTNVTTTSFGSYAVTHTTGQVNGRAYKVQVRGRDGSGPGTACGSVTGTPNGPLPATSLVTQQPVQAIDPGATYYSDTTDWSFTTSTVSVHVVCDQSVTVAILQTADGGSTWTQVATATGTNVTPSGARTARLARYSIANNGATATSSVVVS